MDLPPFITAATGMDALTHNRPISRFHPLAEGIAAGRMTLINQSIEQAVNKLTLKQVK
jgi:alcohol dehydrogenase class IV